MAGYSIIRVLLVLAGCIPCLVTGQTTNGYNGFTSVPGLLRVTINETAELTWRVDYPLTSFERGNLHRYPSDVLVGSMIDNNLAVYGPMYGPDKLALSIDQGNTYITFSIFDVTTADGDGYLYQHWFPGYGFREDNTAVIYVYDRPTKPVMTGEFVVVDGDSVILTCTSELTSVPEEHHNDLWFYWTRNGVLLTNDDRHVIQGPYNNQMNLSHALPEDNNATYECTAREFGSSLEASTDVTLIVLFWEMTPGKICEIDGRGICLYWIFGAVYHETIDSIFWRYLGPDGSASPVTAMIYDGDTDEDIPLNNWVGRVYYQRGSRSGTICFTKTIFEFDYGWFEVDVTTGGYVIPKSIARMNIFCCECFVEPNATSINLVRRQIEHIEP